MATIIDMPKLSDTMTTGTLVKWLKKEGETVASGMMIAEIETDKATMELESFEDGVLLKQVAAVGAQVAVGAPICVIGKKDEDISGLKLESKGGGEEKKEEKPAAKKEPESKGEEPSGEDEEEVEESKEEAKPEAVKKSEPAKTSKPAAPAPAPAATAASGRVRISPLARKLAEEKGVDFSRIEGTGPGGRIVRADILAAKDRPAAAAGAAPASAGVFKGPIAEAKDMPLSNMRATIAKRLLEAKTQIPHFYLEIEIDAAPLLALRVTLNTALEAKGVKLSVNDFILKACVEALRRVPAVNCSFEGTLIRQHPAVHMAFAVAIEDGLITPVIRDASDKSIFEISAEAKALAPLAKTKKLKPDQYTGGTFTVSNLGMMGVDRFSAIINPPNAAILAVGATVKKPVVGPGDTIVVGQRMSLTLSCDHRVVDGALGATWLAALKQLLEQPALLLL
ncbi:MAG TPA: pyruvate dehydrogenase complex dihydrolipoamide acetyltransferase [Opitutaceae bacterium]|nr:pyruvate dehydrogenase complex dihydrolipoamide acetyltransferase [Opitutaceae bacterium]